MNNNKTVSRIAEAILSNHRTYPLQYISSKWFSNGEDITKRISIVLRGYCHSLGMPVVTEDDLANIESEYISRTLEFPGSGDPQGIWPEMEIVKDARAKASSWKKQPFAFPLTVKQMLIINRLLYHPEDERSIIILSGCGGSGKSTFGNLICQLFENDVSVMSAGELSSNKFSRTEALRHRLIYSSEISDSSFDGEVMKRIASGEVISTEIKFGATSFTKTQSKFLYCCNVVPYVNLEDSGMTRRICYYYRNTPIANPDANIRNRLFSYDELLNIAIIALREYENDQWFDRFQKETTELLLQKSVVYNVFKYAEQNHCIPESYDRFRNIAQNMGFSRIPSLISLQQQLSVITDQLSVDDFAIRKACELFRSSRKEYDSDELAQ